MRISDWSSDVCSSDLLRDDGLADLSRRLADTAPTLQSLIASGAWDAAEQAGRADGPDLAPGALALRPPIGANARIFCVGVNYPDRPGEFSDGAPPPRYPSLFVRFASSFVGHDCAVRSDEHTSELQSLMRISYAV